MPIVSPEHIFLCTLTFIAAREKLFADLSVFPGLSTRIGSKDKSGAQVERCYFTVGSIKTRSVTKSRVFNYPTLVQKIGQQIKLIYPRDIL